MFIICGGKAYMDYVLPTNPASKNKAIRWIARRLKVPFSIDDRMKFACITGNAHLYIGMIGWYSTNKWTLLVNLLFNIYPCIVQLYVGYRCLKVKSIRYKHKIMYS